MGIQPKIGITGLPRSGKSAVLQKTVDMLIEQRKKELTSKGEEFENYNIVGGMLMEPLVVDGERVGFECINYQSGERAVIAHREIDSRMRVLGYGIDLEELERVGVPAIEDAARRYEVIMVDEIGKFTVESDLFVRTVRAALEADKPTLMTLHKKSRHPLLQDIRRRDDARVLEVTPVNRPLLPYKIHKLLYEVY
ncbi:MAG: nucleoside-triphosphatase [Candidatus Thermoplasmatota archaeon]|nr:nucleoside-triphosphatase [Candidatus Thermoplasmatota archaeon]MEE3134528.1 nucleoside-triphosphatase [Candidatus Thermoplasmatota archaeon]CAI8253727.1 MAG: Nucleoside-triphosphatase THEP1 [Euryarchaeota archaeon]|tara:strand:- start:2226 stop:2810 length:585 start_codon:yes stop_codon:yes gene_type:complete